LFDPKIPWKLPREKGYFAWGGCRMSKSEWQALLELAQQGDSEAEWRVAEVYGDGCKDKRGKAVVRKSRRKATEWLQRSAEHGCAGAQTNLGNVLSNGAGARKDIEKALFWYKKALRSAYGMTAASNIAVTYRAMGNLRAAFRWFQKSAVAGDDDALVEVGIHYYWGRGVKKSPVAAVQCFRKATKGKNICGTGRDDAFFFLGLAHLEGQGVKKSVARARKLLQRANVDNDHPAARQLLKKIG
jgi:TPR repeat protein